MQTLTTSRSNMKKVWFVTGTSQGLGKALVEKLLSKGYRVAATSRNVEELKENFGYKTDKFLPIELNLTDELQVKKAIDKTVAHFGNIDVVVNNAGYAQYGFIEEATDEEVRKEYNINVFGLLNVLRHSIPYLREQRSGNIINISSKGGFHAGKATGIYCSSKYAVEGISEALYYEMKDYNVKVTAVKPGGIRTNFYGSLRQTQNIKEPYIDFHIKEELAQKQYSGKEPGDPKRVAELLIRITESKNTPLHLFVGQDAYNSAMKKYREVKTDMDQWHDFAVDINYIDE